MKDHIKAYRKTNKQKHRDASSKSEAGISFSEEECIIKSER